MSTTIENILIKVIIKIENGVSHRYHQNKSMRYENVHHNLLLTIL